MQQEQVMELVASASQLMEQLQRLSQQAGQPQTAAVRELQQVGGQLPAVLDHAADRQLGQLAERVQEQLGRGAEQTVEQFNRKLLDISQRLEGLVQASQQHAMRIEQATRRMWLAFAGLALGGAVVLVAGIGLGRHYAAQIREQQITAELLRAYNNADVTLCGGRLCANVDGKGQRYGERSEYQPIRPRP